MMASTSRTSAVLPDALAALASGRVLILDGAVDDHVLMHGRPVELADALAEGWGNASDATLVRWTPSNGLRIDDDADRARIEAVLPHDEFDAALNQAALDRADPIDVATLLSQLFAQEHERVLVVVEHAELVCMEGTDPLSRRANAALVQALEAFDASEELHAFVLLTPDLGRLPSSVSERACVARLRVAAHSADDRALVAAAAFNRKVSDPQIERVALASTGVALKELAMLPAHARVCGLDLEQSRELLSSFQSGHRVDPWAALTRERAQQVRSEIRAAVFGQDRAVCEVLQRLDVARSGLDLDPPSNGPRKSRMELFLVGPTGVGKNELARALAAAIFGDPSALLVLDMSTYQQEHSGERLFGAPPGFVGYEESTPLVNHLRERPFTVIVFDEIEKAHANVWLRLMGAIDEGRVTDTRGVEASLEHAIVIFTSNIGGRSLLARARRGDFPVEEVEALSLNLVEAHLSQASYETPEGELERGLGRPEIWGRFAGSVVPFDLLRESAVSRIVARMCRTLQDSARRTQGIELTIDTDSVTAVLLDELGPPGSWNGRLIRGHLDRLLRRPLASRIVDEGSRPGGRIHVVLRPDRRVDIA